MLSRASSFRERGQAREAAAAYEELLRFYPHLADSWFNLALMRRRLGQFQPALDAYAEALKRKISGPEEVHLNRAVILSDDLRRPDEAQQELEAALRLNPDYEPALLNLGNLHEDLGRRPEATGAYERVLRRSPANALALSRLSGMQRARTADDPILQRLRTALTARQSDADRALLLFALAQQLDASGAYTEAFDTARNAKTASLRAAGLATRRHDRAAMQRRIAAQVAAFSTPEPKQAAALTPTPIFIVGMFRSGSTLLEQILGAHPDVAAGGELPLVPKIAAAARPYPASIASATREQMDRAAAAYLAEVRQMFPAPSVVTDKRPDNFEHLGLIKRMFPNARILHTQRAPLDIIVSTHFLHIDPSMDWAFTPEDTASQIVACEQMMAHWKSLYPDDILTVGYEALLASPEATIRNILAFLGLPWSDACLSFYQAPVQVRTASVWQVREALNQRSVARWRHYETQLAGAMEILRAADLPTSG